MVPIKQLLHSECSISCIILAASPTEGFHHRRKSQLARLKKLFLLVFGARDTDYSKRAIIKSGVEVDGG